MEARPIAYCPVKARVLPGPLAMREPGSAWFHSINNLALKGGVLNQTFE